MTFGIVNLLGLCVMEKPKAKLIHDVLLLVKSFEYGEDEAD